jgi:hypothetical protein
MTFQNKNLWEEKIFQKKKEGEEGQPNRSLHADWRAPL